MELSPEELHGSDALFRWPREPVAERRPGAPFFIEGGHTNHAPQLELHVERLSRHCSSFNSGEPLDGDKAIESRVAVFVDLARAAAATKA
jgi:hypothetical protein